MIDRIKRLRKDELVFGGFTLFWMINLYNFLNYLFHFSMARLLGPADYGILATLMSIIYILSFPSEAIQTVVVKYTTRLNIKEENGKIKDLMYRSIKRGFIFSGLLFLVYLCFSIVLSNILKINFFLLALTGFFVFFVFFIPVTRGILQGKKKFFGLGVNMLLESIIKLTFGVSVVLVGWGIYGVIGAVVGTGIFAFFLSFLFIPEVMISRRERDHFIGVYKQSIFIGVALFSVVLMYSLDIILAKIFFTAEIAGKYAVLSMMGKMILFGTMGVGKAMFPLSSEGYERGEDTWRMLIKALKMVGIISTTALLIYLLFPKFIISLLFGKEYLGMENLLFIIGMAYTSISYSNLLILYRLSRGVFKRRILVLPIFVILQVVLLSIFNSSILDFSVAFLAVNLLMFIYSLIMFRK